MKKILICSNSFFPAYKSGGPVRSLTNLVDSLSQDFCIDIITKDRDLGDLLPFTSVEIDKWVGYKSKSNVRVFYLSKEENTFAFWKSILECDYDVIYLNGFFDYNFSIKVYLSSVFLSREKIKILLAPRGELTDGAMSLKTNKKRLFLFLFNFFNLNKKIKFHFTSLFEKDDAPKYLKAFDSVLCPNMHEPYPEFFNKNKSDGRLNILFLSRLSEKKQLHIILKALTSLEVEHDKHICFNVVGRHDDEKYFDYCKRLCKQITNNNIEVKFWGEQNRKQVQKHYQSNHLFVLPTLNENYGHAIVEAMVNSCILLISSNTPWSEVSSHGGFVVENQLVDEYRKHIISTLSMGDLEFNQRTKSIYDYCTQILERNEKYIKSMFD